MVLGRLRNASVVQCLAEERVRVVLQVICCTFALAGAVDDWRGSGAGLQGGGPTSERQGFVVSCQTLNALFLHFCNLGQRVRGPFSVCCVAGCMECAARMLSQALHHAWHHCLHGMQEALLVACVTASIV